MCFILISLLRYFEAEPCRSDFLSLNIPTTNIYSHRRKWLLSLQAASCIDKERVHAICSFWRFYIVLFCIKMSQQTIQDDMVSMYLEASRDVRNLSRTPSQSWSKLLLLTCQPQYVRWITDILDSNVRVLNSDLVFLFFRSHSCSEGLRLLK